MKFLRSAGALVASSDSDANFDVFSSIADDLLDLFSSNAVDLRPSASYVTCGLFLFFADMIDRRSQLSVESQDPRVHTSELSVAEIDDLLAKVWCNNFFAVSSYYRVGLRRHSRSNLVDRSFTSAE